MFRPNPKPEPKPKVKKIYKYKRKPTGEKELFDKLISERLHRSFLSGKIIININHSNCHHAISKGKDSTFRLCENNIIFLTNEEHNLIHFGTQEQRDEYAYRNNCDWKKIDDLIKILKNSTH